MPDRIQFPQAVAESAIEYRERMARARGEALEWRQQQLEQQSSPVKSASERIQTWERLHQLDLPRTPGHRLLDVIAADTGLSRDEVRAEQLARAAGSKA